jgi:signal peptidase I
MIQTLNPESLNARFSLSDILPAAGLPHVGHLFCLKITSWSMFPAIHKGDVIEVGPIDRIAAGDVVVFHHTGELVCHRVIDIGPGDDIHTQGDQATRHDPPIRRQDILGTVTVVIRRHRRFPPAVVPATSFTGVFRMRMDLLLTTLLNRLHDAVLNSAAFLKRRVWVRHIATRALRSALRFDIGIRAPIRLVQAYRFVPFHRIPPDAGASGDVIILARLGRYPLGTLNSASGELCVRRIAAGLGLEECLHDVRRQMQSVHTNDRPAILHVTNINGNPAWPQS